MLYLAENLKKYRMQKNLTQEELADYLGVTPQSISKWERNECYPDITFLPALAYIFETSVDLLIGINTMRAEETRFNIHKKANEFQQKGDYVSAEKIYRDALLIYPNKPGMILGLAGVLALKGNTSEAVSLIEKGLPLSLNEKQKATMRAALCILYYKCDMIEKAAALAAELPHMRESREMILPLIQKGMTSNEIDKQIKFILLGEEDDVR